MVNEVDKRLVFSSELTEKDIDIYSALDERFTAHGITKPQADGELYYRLPKEVAKTVSKFLMVTALAAIGLGTSFKDFKKSGINPMIHGFIISALVVVVAIAVEWVMYRFFGFDMFI